MRFSSTSFLERTGSITRIPLSFTIEAWIRFDINNTVTQGDMQLIYRSVRAGYSFAILLDNNLIKVQINNQEVNQFFNWIINANWRYLGITITRAY